MDGCKVYIVLVWRGQEKKTRIFSFSQQRKKIVHNNKSIKLTEVQSCSSKLSLKSSVDKIVQQVLYLLTFYSMFCSWKLLVLLISKTMVIVCLFAVVPPNTNVLSTGLKKIIKVWCQPKKHGGCLVKTVSLTAWWTLQISKALALFCPTFVACPYIFADVIKMVVVTIMQDMVQPLVIQNHFRTPYIYVKNKVEGSQGGGRDGNPRL